MIEAVNPVIEYAFMDVNFEKLTFANVVGNNRSRRIVTIQRPLKIWVNSDMRPERSTLGV